MSRLVLLILALTPVASWPDVGTPLEAGALADEVLAVNPMAKAAAAAARSEESSAAAVGLWPDPMFMAERMMGPGGEAAPASPLMPGWDFRLRQEIPVWGKNIYDRRSAAAGARATGDEAEATRLMLVEEAKHAYLELYTATKMKDLAARQKQLWADYERVAAALYAAGAAMQTEVLRAQVERTRMANQVLGFETAEVAARGRINALLGRPAGETLPPVGELPEVTIPYTLDELYNKAAARNPEVKAAEARLARAQAMRAAETWRYVPDLAAGVGYTRMDPTEMAPEEAAWSFSAEVEIPIFMTVGQRRMRAAATAEVEAMTGEIADKQNQVRRNVESLYATITAADRQLVLYRDGLLPQAEAAVRGAAAGYAAGNVDFIMLLENQMTWYMTQMEYVELQMRKHEAVATLEVAIGERFY
jgi:outer membrane protein TolC